MGHIQKSLGTKTNSKGLGVGLPGPAYFLYVAFPGSSPLTTISASCPPVANYSQPFSISMSLTAGRVN